MTCLPDLLWDSNEHSPSASEPAFLDLVYDELHRMASSLLRHERAAHTLQTSGLVNEAFLRLSAARSLRVEDRQHFLRIAARSMRQILIDYARGRGRNRSGSGAWNGRQCAGSAGGPPRARIAPPKAAGRPRSPGRKFVKCGRPVRGGAGMTPSGAARRRPGPGTRAQK